VVALLAQSLAESRLLIESGWLLLTALAVLTKQPANEAEEALSAERPAVAGERPGR